MSNIQFAVDEGVASGTRVGVLPEIDGVATGGGERYVIDRTASGPGADAFEVVYRDLRVAEGALVDHETWPEVELTLLHLGADGGEIGRVFATVEIGDVEEAPDTETPGTFVFTLDEEPPAGTRVGVLPGIDGVVTGGGERYVIDAAASDPGAENFTILHRDLHVADGSALDYETAPETTLAVVKLDGAEREIDRYEVTVRLNDISETGPPAPDTDWRIGEEPAPGTRVGVLPALDGLVSGGGERWEIDHDASDAGSENFAVLYRDVHVSDGSALDFETKAEHRLVFVRRDGDGGELERLPVTLSLDDVEERPEPEAPSELAFSIGEEPAPGTRIGVLPELDGLVSGGGERWQIDHDASGPGSDALAVVYRDLRVKDGAALDHETLGTVELSVVKVDADGEVLERLPVTVGLEDREEAPDGPEPTAFDFEVGENAIAGTRVGVMPELDFFGAGERFEIDPGASGPGADAFAVIHRDLRIRDADRVDFERQEEFTLSVVKRDAGGAEIGRYDVTVDVLDEAEPAEAPDAFAFDIPANAGPGSRVGVMPPLDYLDGGGERFEIDLARSDPGAEMFAVIDRDLRIDAGAELQEGMTLDLSVVKLDAAGNEIDRMPVTVEVEAPAGTAGDDVLLLDAGERIDGGDGHDTLKVAAARADVSVERAEDGALTLWSDAGVHEVAGVERLEFTDGSLSLDLSGEDAAFVWRTYAAAFDRTPDEPGLRHWVEAMEDGATRSDVADAFVASEEFALRYGPDPEDFVKGLYWNALGRAPDDDGFAHWLDRFASGELDRSDMLESFADCEENVARSAEHAGTGLWSEMPDALIL